MIDKSLTHEEFANVKAGELLWRDWKYPNFRQLCLVIENDNNGLIRLYNFGKTFNLVQHTHPEHFTNYSFVGSE